MSAHFHAPPSLVIAELVLRVLNSFVLVFTFYSFDLIFQIDVCAGGYVFVCECVVWYGKQAM